MVYQNVRDVLINLLGPVDCSSILLVLSFSFMAKPHIFDLDATSMSLRWRPPTNPNGKIQSYKIYDADRLIVTLPSNKTYYLIEDLKPFTFYNYVIEVCTDGGCTRSEVTRIQTTAASPEVNRFIILVHFIYAPCNPWLVDWQIAEFPVIAAIRISQARLHANVIS